MDYRYGVALVCVLALLAAGACGFTWSVFDSEVEHTKNKCEGSEYCLKYYASDLERNNGKKADALLGVYISAGIAVVAGITAGLMFKHYTPEPEIKSA